LHRAIGPDRLISGPAPVPLTGDRAIARSLLRIGGFDRRTFWGTVRGEGRDVGDQGPAPHLGNHNS